MIALLRAFSGTIPTARNSGFAKAWMAIPNCTSAQRGICSTTKNDDVLKKTKWNATKRWIWLCYGQNPLMSINSKSHNWHRFSTDMQLCNFNKCNKITVIGRPTGRKKGQQLHHQPFFPPTRFVTENANYGHKISSSVASTTIFTALDSKFVPSVQFLDCMKEIKRPKGKWLHA